MKISDKYMKIAAMFQKALKTESFGEVNSISLEDLKLAKHILIADKDFPYYSLLGQTIKEKESAAMKEGFAVSGISSHFAKNKTIFLAHRFEEAELVGKLKSIIEKNGYQWKEGRREDLGSISEDILTKINSCGFFVALMTKKDELKNGKFTVSSWLVEEKGAALAFGHRPLIMVEEDVERHYVGFLQSDDEMIYFKRSNFDIKAEEAVKKIINTYNKYSNIVAKPAINQKNNGTQHPPLEPIQADILKTLADEKYLVEQLAHKFQMPVTKMQYYLDVLGDEDYIGSHRRISQPPTYFLGKKGRAYLVQNGII